MQLLADLCAESDSCWEVNSSPSTLQPLNCKHQTPNTKPQTSKTQTLNPKPETRNPKPKLQNPNPKTPNAAQVKYKALLDILFRAVEAGTTSAPNLRP